MLDEASDARLLKKFAEPRKLISHSHLENSPDSFFDLARLVLSLHGGNE